MLVLNPDAARTEKELAFAFYLAKEEFAAKTAISDKLVNEAMLFLANETNFTSAAKKVGAKETKDFVLVIEKDVPLVKLKKEMMLTKIKRLSLQEWGKKQGIYFEGELAIERMALARIRN